MTRDGSRLSRLRAEPCTTSLWWLGRWARRSTSGSVLLACAPKSASSTLLGWLGAATGYREVALGEPGRDDDHLQISRLLDQRQRFVAHQHVLASPSVRRMVRTFDLRVIVQTRDVADSVVSFCDHVGKEPTNPIFKVPRGFPEMERPDQLRLVASVFAPWVMAFVASWESAERAGIPVTWVSFDDVVTSPTETIRRCVAATDLPSDAVTMSGETDLPVRRLNVGGAGRGRSEIPSETLDWMDGLLPYYRLSAPERIMTPRPAVPLVGESADES